MTGRDVVGCLTMTGFLARVLRLYAPPASA